MTADFVVGIVGTVAVVIFGIIPFMPKSLLIHEFSLFLLFFACTTRILRKIIKILTFVWALLYLSRKKRCHAYFCQIYRRGCYANILPKLLEVEVA